jgi:hypothetical protein
MQLRFYLSVVVAVLLASVAEYSYVEGDFEIGLADSGVEDRWAKTRSTPLMLLCSYWLESSNYAPHLQRLQHASACVYNGFQPVGPPFIPSASSLSFQPVSSAPQAIPPSPVAQLACIQSAMPWVSEQMVTSNGTVDLNNLLWRMRAAAYNNCQ